MADGKANDEKSPKQEAPLSFDTAYIYHGIDFERLFYEGLSPEDERPFEVIQQALDGISEDNAEQRARDAAMAIQKLFPIQGGPVKDDGGYIWQFWKFYHLIAMCIPHRHAGQRLVFEIVRNLKELGESTNPYWKDLPKLGMVSREALKDPTAADCVGGGEPYTFQQWLNLNSFLARLHGTGTEIANNFAVWHIEFALEEDLVKDEEELAKLREEFKDDIQEYVQDMLDWKRQEEAEWRRKHGLDEKPEDKPQLDSGADPQDQPAEKAEDAPGEKTEEKPEAKPEETHSQVDADHLGPDATTRVAVACEWLIHCSPVVLRFALTSSSRPPLNKQEKGIFHTGPLFSGNPGVDLERWGFWKRRLGELRDKVGNKEVVQSMDEALEKMSAAEMAVAGQL